MTPTLPGRWQTRVVLLWTIGLGLTVLFMALFGLFERDLRDPAVWTLITLLGYVTGLGLAWDIVYDWLQGFRHDGDWPVAFHFASGLLEGAVLFALFRLELLPGLAYHDGDGWRFLAHYGSVFLATFGFVYGPMRVLAPGWRFRGGELR